MSTQPKDFEKLLNFADILSLMFLFELRMLENWIFLQHSLIDFEANYLR